MIRATIAAVAAIVLAAAATRAKELPQAIRDMAERAFLEGRLDDLDTILAGAEEPVDAFPKLLRNLWWRRSEAISQEPYRDDEALPIADRRLAWLACAPPRGPYPMPRGGGEDPHPVLTALVLDRQLREGHGHHGLPENSPLVRLGQQLDPEVRKRTVYFLTTWTRHLMTSTYGAEPTLAEDERSADAAAQSLSARNGRWALVLLAVFVLVPLLAGWRLTRPATPEPS